MPKGSSPNSGGNRRTRKTILTYNDTDSRGAGALSLKQTGELMGLTTAAAHMLERRAIRKLWRDKKLRRIFLKCLTT